jgi:N utilization substance protein B
MSDFKKRRHAREWAVQILFQIDMNHSPELEPILAAFWRQQVACSQEEQADADRAGTVPAPLPTDAALNAVAPEKLRQFAERLVRGVSDNRAAIDEKLAFYTQNWPLHRMGAVDRNVLRLAIYEMFFGGEVPAVVCINEAVDLAKFFSSSESGRFVNGILDRAAKDAPRMTRK